MSPSHVYPGSDAEARRGPARRPFFGRVESLRGLGALAVAGFHFSGHTLHNVALFPGVPVEEAGALPEALRRLGLACLPGHAALMIFFVISGFVLRLSLEYGPQRVGAATVRFLLGRLFRIYPVVIFGMLLTAGLTRWQLPASGEAALPLTPRLLAANLLLLDVSLNTTLWALQVELLMAPVILVLYFLERRRGPGVVLVLALVTTALAYHTRWAIWRPLSVHCFPFILGMVVPTLGRRFVDGFSHRAATAWAVGGIAALVLAGPCLGVYSRTSSVIEAYAAVIVVSLIAFRPDLRGFRCLDATPLRRLGLASGSYYVLHMATPALVAALVPPAWCANAPSLVRFLGIPAWLLALAPLMVGSYYLIEAPGIALGRRLIRACRLDSPAVSGERDVAGRQAA